MIRLQELATGALLHDIGLLHISPRLLRRPATLSGKDLDEYQRHPRLGAIVLEARQEFAAEVLHIVAEHHATPEGKGYPRETQGQATDEASRIVMVADRYDESLSGQGGLGALSPHASLQRLFHEAQAGSLDQALVSLFITLVGVYPVYSEVELNTKERGMIVAINPEALHRPVVTLTHGATGLPLTPPPTIDLMREEGASRSITRVLASALDTPAKLSA